MSGDNETCPVCGEVWPAESSPAQWIRNRNIEPKRGSTGNKDDREARVEAIRQYAEKGEVTQRGVRFLLSEVDRLRSLLREAFVAGWDSGADRELYWERGSKEEDKPPYADEAFERWRDDTP